MGLIKLFSLFCLTWALLDEGLAANLTKNLDLDSIISNMFGNQGSYPGNSPSYPGNSQSYPTGQGNPQYHDPSNANNVSPGNNYPGYPTNTYQGRSPQYQRPENGYNNNDPRYNYQGRPSQGQYPQYQDSNNGANNINPGNNYPGGNYPGNIPVRPNQVNNPQGNMWNNANQNPGINYPGGSQFYPGSGSQGNPQYQRPGGGLPGNPFNGLPGNYHQFPGMGGNWNDNGNPDVNYDPNGFYNQAQRHPGTNWNNPNGYPNNLNQIGVPGNQFPNQGVGSQGFDQQNPGLLQGQPIQYPQGHTYRPGLQNSGSFNPSQGSSGLNHQLPNSQNKPNFKPTLNDPNQNGVHKDGQNSNEKVLDNFPITKSSSQSQMKQCVQDCSTSTEYNPRCGLDNVTYFNEEKVQCARKCGFDVKIIRNGACLY